MEMNNSTLKTIKCSQHNLVYSFAVWGSVPEILKLTYYTIPLASSVMHAHVHMHNRAAKVANFALP